MSYRPKVTPQSVAATPCRGVNSFSESGGRLAGGGDALGKTAKTVGRSKDEKAVATKRREFRADRYRYQRHAAALLDYEARVGLCRYAMQSEGQGVGVIGSTYGDDPQVRASFQGLQTCGSVWHCPLCAARISETRRQEMNHLLAWARAKEYRVVMVTLTTRHGADDDLDYLLERLKDAKKRLHQHRRWKALKNEIVGSVTATEVTGGGLHGWHPHLHMICVLENDLTALDLGDAWRGALRGAGLDGTGVAYQEQNAQAAGAYIAKGSWGAAEEITLGHQKRGRGRTGRSPAQLLAASCDDGDTRAGALWKEYAEAFHGRRQLVWSRGLKTLAGVGETDDQEAAQDDGQDGQVSAEITRIHARDWRSRNGARRRRARVLDAAETDGAEGVSRVVADRGDESANVDSGKDDELFDDRALGPVVAADGEAGTDCLYELLNEIGVGQSYDPPPDGLAAAALAVVRPPPGQAP